MSTTSREAPENRETRGHGVTEPSNDERPGEMPHDVILAPSPNLTSVQRLLAHDAEPYRQSRLVVGSNNETIFAVTN